MMDASSIITQVSRDHEGASPQLQPLSLTLPTILPSSVQVSITGQQHNQQQGTPSSSPLPANNIGVSSDHETESTACVGTAPTSKKSKTRNFLRSLLCCWRGGGQGKGPPATAIDGAPSSPLVLQTRNLQYDQWLLPPVRHQDMHKKCMIIDLDETLVHSSFKPINNADFVVPVEIEGKVHQVYVLKRPHVDEFLRRVGELYECVLFTASLAKYANPVADLLDRWGVFRARLFRDSCVCHHGNYVKDLNKLGRDLRRVVIVDNSPASYIFHPDNAIPINSWFDDMSDSELLDLIPFFEKLSKVDSVYTVLCNSNNPFNGSGTPTQESSPS